MVRSLRLPVIARGAGRRVARNVPILIGLSLAAFLFGHIAPGDPAYFALVVDGFTEPTEAEIQAMRVRLGLDRPPAEQYVRWVVRAAQGDLGRSFRTGRQIHDEIAARLPVTLSVAMPALVVTAVVGIGLGTLAGRRPESIVGAVIEAIYGLLIATPGFLIAILLVTLVGERVSWLPVAGVGTPAHLLLPVLSVSAGGVGVTTRLMRSAVIEEQSKRYVTYAHSRGTLSSRVLWSHIVPNALPAAVTFLANAFAGIIGGTVIVESIFAIPGLGSYAVQAGAQQGPPGDPGLCSDNRHRLHRGPVLRRHGACGLRSTSAGRESVMRRIGTISRALSIGSLTFLTLLSLIAPLVASHDPLRVDMPARLEQPTTRHPLGTDGVGRDALSRVLYGGRTSLALTLVSAGATAVIATIFGVLAGYRRGRVDDIVMVVTGLFQGIPGIAVLIAIAGLLGPGAPALILGLVLVAWPTFSRVVRTEVIRIAALPFVESLRVSGASHGRIILRHIVPNVAGPILVLLTTRMATSIISVASLSFLGLGVQPPVPDWGVMIRDALPYMRTRPLLLIAPCACVLSVTYGMSAVAELVRRRLDVRRARGAVA